MENEKKRVTKVTISRIFDESGQTQDMLVCQLDKEGKLEITGIGQLLKRSLEHEGIRTEDGRIILPLDTDGQAFLNALAFGPDFENGYYIKKIETEE